MARALERHWIAVELSPTYVREAENRIGSKQSTEVASLASGVLKLVGFANQPGRKSMKRLSDSVATWMSGFDVEHYARLQREHLDCVFEGAPFASREIKARKPEAWRYFDAFFAAGDPYQEPLRLVSAALDSIYPLRRRWNGIRKFIHSRTIVEDLLVAARQPSLIESIVRSEPSSFRLSEAGRIVTFLEPRLKLHEHPAPITNGGHADKTRQASMF